MIPLVLLIIGAMIPAEDPDDVLENLEYVDGHLLNRRLLNLPENQWVRIYPQSFNLFQGFSLRQLFNFGSSWIRPAHAGLAFDSKRKSLLIFGSDSHGENWDNSVHEFNLHTLKWTEHYPPSPKESYRADDQGNAIAGENGLYPWAMHTYDSIAYVPEMDALIVTSKTDHTPPPTEQAKQATINPTWIYHLDTREWSILAQRNSPSFFASGSTYDPITFNLWAYTHGSLWQFDVLLQQWKKIPGPHQANLTGHFTMTTDTHRHQLVFFGDYKKTNRIWTYTPGQLPEENGKWEKKQPGGDSCPEDDHFPVAYDSHQDVFLLVPDDAEKSVTLVYSPATDTYFRVAGANAPANGMNYMMEYDPYHRLFWLITGDWHSPLRVWAFRLNMATLIGPAH